MTATEPVRGSEAYPRRYLCTVLAEGPIAGALESLARFTLADMHTVSSKLSVRWLRYQALRVADGLDPDPAELPEGTTRRVTGVTGDVPTELRAWAHDPNAQERARQELARTGCVRLFVHDSLGRYLLSAQQVADLPDAVPPSSPADAGTRPTDRRKHPAHGRHRHTAGHAA